MRSRPDAASTPSAPTGRPAVTRPVPAPRQVPEELVAAAVMGERAAVDQLLGMIRPLVAGYCRTRLGPGDRSLLAVDDVVQEVCLATLTALPYYRSRGKPFAAFVYGIAAHKLIDAHRAAARTPCAVADVPDSVAADAGPEQHALNAELSAQLCTLLSCLPDQQRHILVLRVAVGLSTEETADVLGMSTGATRVAQHRALHQLRTLVLTPGSLRGATSGPVSRTEEPKEMR